jgi:hypothetical protein
MTEAVRLLAQSAALASGQGASHAATHNLPRPLPSALRRYGKLGRLHFSAKVKILLPDATAIY